MFFEIDSNSAYGLPLLFSSLAIRNVDKHRRVEFRMRTSITETLLSRRSLEHFLRSKSEEKKKNEKEKERERRCRR